MALIPQQHCLVGEESGARWRKQKHATNVEATRDVNTAVHALAPDTSQPNFRVHVTPSPPTPPMAAVVSLDRLRDARINGMLCNAHSLSDF